MAADTHVPPDTLDIQLITRPTSLVLIIENAHNLKKFKGTKTKGLKVDLNFKAENS